MISFMGILLLIPLALAHTIPTNEIIRSDGTYNIKFSVDPEFPLTNKETHLDFEVWDNRGQLVEDKKIEITLIKGVEKKVLSLSKAHGHYEAEYIFKEPGAYKLIPIIDEEELNIIFELEVDSFGISGVVRSSVIFLFLLIIIVLMYKDCKSRKKERGAWK